MTFLDYYRIAVVIAVAIIFIVIGLIDMMKEEIKNGK